MKLKPSKCLSFSLKSGSPFVKHFSIGEAEVPSIVEEEQKFLGKVIFFDGKSASTYELVEKIIKEKIDNLEKTEIRAEFKIEIYQMYILPSLRFLLTVHEITKTHLKKLDVLTDQYVKRWIGLPRCATTEIIHAKYAMNIKTITALYKEAHCVTHVATRLKGDSQVNKILDNKIERESEFNKKHSITIEAEKVY